MRRGSREAPQWITEMTLPPRDESVCPRCGGPFHCGVNDDQPCWCVDVRLDGATLAALNERYRGCLCMRCLAQLQEGTPIDP